MKNETAKDPILSKLKRYIREGFPPRPDNDEPELRHYRKLENSLTVDNGCVFNGSRIVIPEVLRRKVLDLLHLGHMGMQRMKQLARSAVYWTHIDENIADLVRGCTSCAEHQNAPEKAPIHPWILPEKPWSRIHVDHAINVMGSNWLIVTDAYSKYPCIHQTQLITSKATMLHLDQDFAHFGYPHTIVSDNATTFTAEEFQEFCNERGIYHLTGAPYHPATNGSAERLVQSFKQSLKKSLLPPKEAVQEFLLQYRRTPLPTGYSPSELLNGRQIRAKIDIIIPSPAHTAQAQQWKVNRRVNKGKALIDKVFKYQIGTPCYALYCGPSRDRELRWVPAIVKAIHGPRSVYVKVIPKGPVWRRHLDQLRPRYGADQDDDPGFRAKPTQELHTKEGSIEKPKRRNPRLPNSDEYGPNKPRRSKRLQEKRQASAVGATGPKPDGEVLRT